MELLKIGLIAACILLLFNVLFSAAFPSSSTSVMFFETFDKPWEGRWIPSEQKEYEGRWKHAKNEVNDDYGLLVTQKASKYGIAVELPQVCQFNDDPVVLQYELKTQNKLECGNAYLKYLMIQNYGWDLKHFDNESSFSIMFGPYNCGATKKVHFSFRHKHPRTHKYVEHHLKFPPVPVLDDKFTHVYTAIIYPDNTLKILIDGEEKRTANLLSDDFDPPLVSPKTIPDPDDKNPEDRNDCAKISVPVVKKSDAEPEETMDPDCTKPDDWDDDKDGQCEAHKILKCKKPLGCGDWKRFCKRNPNYKGKRCPTMIDNPNCKGIWKPCSICNPEYFELKRPDLEAVSAIGIEIRTMQDGLLLDNILIATDVSVAQEYRDKYWKPKYQAERKIKRTEEEADPLLPQFVGGMKVKCFDFLYKIEDILRWSSHKTKIIGKVFYFLYKIEDLPFWAWYKGKFFDFLYKIEDIPFWTWYKANTSGKVFDFLYKIEDIVFWAWYKGKFFDFLYKIEDIPFWTWCKATAIDFIQECKGSPQLILTTSIVVSIYVVVLTFICKILRRQKRTQPAFSESRGETFEESSWDFSEETIEQSSWDSSLWDSDESRTKSSRDSHLVYGDKELSRDIQKQRDGTSSTRNGRTRRIT